MRRSPLCLRAGTLGLALVLGSATGPQGHAAERPAATLGVPVRLVMPAGGPEKASQVVAFRAERSETVTVEARSLEFDPKIEVFSEVRDSAAVRLGEDDDGGVGMNSRLVLEVRGGTTYRIVARESEDDGGGAFELEVLRGGRALDPVGEREASVSYFEAAIALAGPRGRDMRVAGLMVAQALALKELGRLDEARKRFEQAAAIHEANLGPDHIRVADDLTMLAQTHDDMGDLSAARTLYERALAIQRRLHGPEHQRVAQLLSNLAGIDKTLGDYPAAHQRYEQALAMAESTEGLESALAGSLRNNLGSLLEELGKYPEAIALYQRGLASLEKRYGPEHPRAGLLLQNLASVAMRTGDHEGAHRHYQRALAIYTNFYGPEHWECARVLKNLGTLVRRMGRGEEAQAILQRAHAISEKALGPDHRQTALTRLDLCRPLLERGRVDEADSLCRRSLASLEQKFGSDHPDLGRALEVLATVEDARGRHGAAAAAAARAAAIYAARLGPDHPAVAQALAAQATSLAREGKAREALGLALRAESISGEHLRLTSRWLPEEKARGYAAVRKRGLDQALALACGKTPLAAPETRAVADAVIRSRAVVLDEMAARHRAVSGAADPAAARLIQAFAEASARLANLQVRGRGDRDAKIYRVLLERARNERDSVERALAGQSLVFRRDRDRQRAGLDEVARSLPPRCALVAFARYQPTSPADRPSGRHYAAMVLPSGTAQPLLLPIGSAASIDAAVARWRAAALAGVSGRGGPGRGHEQAYRQAGADLRRLVWDPVAPLLGDAKLVFVVPEGSLALVNLATLPVGERSYVIEGGSLLHYLSAERDLVADAETPAPGTGLLAMGGADFDGVVGEPVATAFRSTRASCADFRTLRFASLPATAYEAREVDSLWSVAAAQPSRGTVLTGAAASEAAFKRLSPGRRTLHVASHGFFMVDRCAAGSPGMRGVLGLVVEEEEDEAVPNAGRDDPLLLAGLALAGANRRDAAGPEEEDGILTAQEVAALELGGVEWAVLSACNTGVGDVGSDEGVLGLRRAFEIAGVRTLIMSLWPVGDMATREWMGALYRARFGRGLDTPSAMRAASLEVLGARRRSGESTLPFSWGGFVAAGDWR